MARITHQIPTHLGVEDHLLLGLTGGQALRLIAGGSLAYTLWDATHDTGLPVRAALTAACLLATLAFALVRPYHRPLEEWVFVAVRYASLPKTTVWQAAPPPQDRRSAERDSDWAELPAAAARRDGKEAP